jgi:hypothetical protein
LGKPFIPKINIHSPGSNTPSVKSTNLAKRSPHSIIGNILLAKSAKSSDIYTKAKANQFLNKLTLHLSNINIEDDLEEEEGLSTRRFLQPEGFEEELR